MRRANLGIIYLICLLFVGNAQSQQPLSDLTLQQTQKMLRDDETTVEQLLDYYLGRIEKFDRQGPSINSLAYLNPSIRAQTRALDKKLQAGKPMGKLFGALVLIKDNIDIKGMPNTAGSWLMRAHRPKTDAFVIARLKAQDALILGKTNLSEWANFRSNKSSSGWSSLHGQTLNPHDTTRSPCGSSSGSGAAIAADFGLLAIGTETDGSVVCPAAINGIVGIKPSLGLVSRSGIIPIAHSQDTAGPMARTVSDAARLLDSMQGKDPSDPTSVAPVNLSDALRIGGLKGKRIGIVRNLMGYHLDMDALFEQQLAHFRLAGAQLVDKANISSKGRWGEHEYQVLLSEFKADLNQYLAQSQAPLKSLQDAIKQNQRFHDRIMPIFGQEIFLEAIEAPALTDQRYLDALKQAKQLTGPSGIDAAMTKHKVDFLIAPTTGPAWKIDHVNGDHFLGSASSAPAVSGHPHITVPMGEVQGLPVGMSFFGGYGQDAQLIQAAFEFEQRAQARVSPDLRADDR